MLRRKKLLGRHNNVAKWLFNNFLKIQKQPSEVFYRKAVLLKTSEYSLDGQVNTCVGVSLIQNIGKFLKALFLKNICEQQLPKYYSQGFLTLHWKTGFFNSISEKSENGCFYFMVSFSWSLYLHTVFLLCGEKYFF